MEKQFKILIEKHPDGYVPYPLGLKDIVVGQGDAFDEALADVKSAIAFHIATFGAGALETGDRRWKHSWQGHWSSWN